jgi:iron complex outermembrane receptor protein
MFRGLFLFGFSLMASLAVAQDGPVDSLDTRTLDEVTISAMRLETPASRVPMAVTVIDQQRIQQGNQQLSLNESLGMVPGLFAQNADNFSQDLRLSIRGFGARSSFGIRGIKVLVDGIPESTPDGTAQVDNIDAGLIRQVQVLRGPSSGLYGNAAGGVIALETEGPPDDEMIELRATGGAYQFQRYQLKGGFRHGKWGGLVYGSYTGTDGFRAHSRMENLLLNGRLSYQPKEGTELTLLLNYVNSPTAQDPGGVDSATFYGDPTEARAQNVQYQSGENLTQGRVALTLRHRLSAKAELRGRAYGLSRDFANRLPFQAEGQVEIDRIYTGGGVSYHVADQLFGKLPYRLVTGVDVDYQADDRRRYDNLDGEQGDLVFDQLETFLSVGAYAVNELQLTARLSGTLALRFDALTLGANDAFVSDGDDSGQLSYQQVNPSLGLSYRFTRLFNLYANVGSSFETPTLQELSANPDGGGGFNPDLTPQQAINYEVGSKGSWGEDLQYSVAAFFIQVENELVPYEIAAFAEREFFRNAGSSDRLGIEAYLMASPLKGFTVTASYTFQQFTYGSYQVRDVRFDGNRLPAIPQHSGYLGVRYAHRAGGYAHGWTTLVGSMYADDANQATVDPYAVVNLRAGWVITIGQVEIEPYLGVNNLLDAVYPGNVRINAFGGRYFEGAPTRNVFGGLRVRFGK